MADSANRSGGTPGTDALERDIAAILGLGDQAAIAPAGGSGRRWRYLTLAAGSAAGICVALLIVYPFSRDSTVPVAIASAGTAAPAPAVRVAIPVAARPSLLAEGLTGQGSQPAAPPRSLGSSRGEAVAMATQRAGVRGGPVPDAPPSTAGAATPAADLAAETMPIASAQPIVVTSADRAAAPAPARQEAPADADVPAAAGNKKRYMESLDAIRMLRSQ